MKAVIIYLNSKQLSIRIPFELWQSLMRHKIDTGQSMSTLVIQLLSDHFGSTDQATIAAGLQQLKLNTGQSANNLINKLLIDHFNPAT